MSYLHKEAFCLMTYATTDGWRERIWNSRDGVTPYTVSKPDGSGEEMRHVDWHLDECLPGFVPVPEMRVFVDAADWPEEIERRINVAIGRLSQRFPELPDSVREDMRRDWTKPGWPIAITGAQWLARMAVKSQ